MPKPTPKLARSRRPEPKRSRRTFEAHGDALREAVYGRMAEGRVVALVDGRTARVEVAFGRTLEAALPQHVSAAWLEAALRVGPVNAGVALVSPERALLWCLFPGPEHDAVVADLELVGRNVRIRAEGQLEVAGPASSLKLDPAGKATLRGKEVLTRASGTNFIKGGSVRIN